MASLISTKTDPAYIPRGTQVLCNSGGSALPFLSTDLVATGPSVSVGGPGKIVVDTTGLKFTCIPMEAVATTETYETGIRNLLAVAWQSDDVSTDGCSVWVSDRSNGTVEFQEVEAGALEGYLWCWSQG